MPRRSSPRRRAGRWFAATVCGALAASVVFAPAVTAGPMAASVPSAAAGADVASSPSPDVEAEFVGRINGLRASRGLSQLRVDGQLLGVARSWTERMVQAGQISHNPNLSGEVSGNWTKLGENVGVGPTVDALMQAFVNSPAHNRNLVDPDWNYVAVGVTRAADGQLYTTHNFMTKPDSAAPPPAPPSAPPVTRPPATPAPTPAPPSGAAPTTAPPAAPPTTVPPAPHPTSERVAAVLDPLRALERG